MSEHDGITTEEAVTEGDAAEQPMSEMSEPETTTERSESVEGPSPSDFLPEKDVRRKGKTERVLNVVLIAVFSLFVLLTVVKGFFITNVTVSQTSMTPTLADGQTIFVSKVSPIRRGQIAVFYEEEPQHSFWSFFRSNQKMLVKRVVAVAGDEIWAEQEGDVYVFKILCGDSGEILSEDYYTYRGAPVDIPAVSASRLYKMTAHIGRENALKIEDDMFFAMGDNRGNSNDSRGDLGQIPCAYLFGMLI